MARDAKSNNPAPKRGHTHALCSWWRLGCAGFEPIRRS